MPVSPLGVGVSQAAADVSRSESASVASGCRPGFTTSATHDAANEPTSGAEMSADADHHASWLDGL